MRLFAFLLASFLATAALMAAPAVKVSVESAQVVLGPGVEPQPHLTPGTKPYRPRLDARFALSGLPKGAAPTFRFWRATEKAMTAVASLPKSRAVKAGAGCSAVEGEVTAQPGGKAYQLKGTVPAPWNGPEFLIIEVRNRGRLVARETSPILETNLPGTARREDLQP